MITIHPISIEDIPVVYSLGEELFVSESFTTLHRMWNEDEVVAHFSEDWDYCFVAKDGKKIIGFILSTLIDKPRSAWIYGHISWLGVSKAYHGKNVAKRLLEKASQILKDKGARILAMDTASDNQPAIRFFEKNGFTEKAEHVYLYKNIDD